MDKTFYTRSDFDECTVIGHDSHFAFDFVAHFEVGIECVPRVRGELFQTESDAFLLVVEVENNDIEFLVERNDLFGVAYAAPRQVGDVDKTIDTAEVDEYAVRGDILDRTFEYLTFFEFGDDFFLLLFELGFDESLVRNNNVFEFLVDFNHFEFHGFANEYIVIANGFNVDLRTGQEGFDAKYIDNHTTLGAALDVTLDDFVVFKSSVHTIPRAGSAGFFVGKYELSFFIFLVFDVDFDRVTHFEIGIVTEFVHRNNAIGFVTDVYNNFAFVDRDNGSFDYLFVFDSVERLVISGHQLFAALLADNFAFFIGVPVEIFNGSDLFFFHNC